MPKPVESSQDSRLDAFFTAAPAGLAILDRELRYVQLNETLAQMNGCSAVEHLGRSVREVLPALAVSVEPILQRILTTGDPALNIEVSGETPAQPGITRYWVASYFPLLGPGGTAEGIGAIVVEDTARRRAEQARRRSGAEYQAIVENAAYGIYRSSLDGRFLKVNPALVQMLGYDSEAEVLALDLERDLYTNPAQRWDLIARFRDAARVQGVETEWKRKDGHRIVVRLSGRPVRSDPGDLLGFEMMAEDVTEPRALEHALRQAQKMETIGQLTSGIAHDFNNLLTVVLTQAKFVSDALPADRADLRRDLHDLSDAARRGAELVQKLLGFSRSQRLDLQAVSLAEYLQEVIATLRRLLPATIELELEADEEGAVVEVDSGALQQMLLNLATNARDAMPNGGTLHMELRRTRLDAEDRPLHAWVQPGPYACIAVSDTGVGMDRPTLARVLEPFFTTKPAGVGTGLGMAMVYGLVKQHKGFVHLYSEPGQGTTVKLYFPLVYRPAERPAAASDLESLPGGSESILLVEDDPALRLVAERLFKRHGYRVLTAVDGAEGLELYRVHGAEIALVVTDLIMPKAGGFDVYEGIRRQSRTTKVLFTSGYPTPNYRKSVAGDDNVAFVTKPWTVSDMLAQVRALLDRTAGGAG
jgi:PAS domain S-box-containing protein